jgi:hypothetical protein
VREVYDEAIPQDRREAVTFGDVVGVVEEVGERYGRWQNAECLDLKGKLGGYGDTVTGRVRLADFYSGAVKDGHWQFTESVAYLRELGALDESDPEDPRVIISNYINSPSNCVASSSYYSVCCINECEALLGNLEERVGTAEAKPGEISALVAALPSATREAGRKLSEPLLAKLQEVADHHGGSVPLHGRLFAQWMHLAYPMECPFPHMAGATSPATATEWAEKTGQSTTLDAAEMMQHIEEAPARGGSGDSEEGVCGMWAMEEALVGGPSGAPLVQGRRGMASTLLRGVIFAAAVASAGLAALNTLRSVRGATGSESLDKFV